MTTLLSGESAVTRANRRLRGVMFICVAVLVFSCLDSLAKWLGQYVHPLQIAFTRYLIATIVTGLYFNPWVDGTRWRTRRPGLQIFRALCLAGSTVCNFISIRHLQLAETVTIGFAAPLMIAALAGPLLGEWIDWKRWMAILVGFAGVIIVTSPGSDGINPYVLVSIGAMLFNTFYSLATRQLAGVDSPGSMLLISNALPVFLIGPAIPFVWVTPSGLGVWLGLSVIGACASIGHFFLIRAYTNAPAPVVAPFSYSQILWMVIIGYVVFGDIPHQATIIGATIVVVSGIYLLYAEHSARRTVIERASAQRRD